MNSLSGLPEGCILSSYHMKNVFFYMVESQTQLTWESQKPGYLLMELLREIVRGLANHNIPNYFIRTNNMIQHRTKEEVQFTLKEVSKLVEYPFFALAALCQKLQMYKKQRNVSNPSTRSSKESVELVSCLELYTVLNQSLYMLGLDRMVNEAVLSSSCFSLICGMNAQMSEFPKYGKLFTATSVPDLLINSALQNVQAGKVHEALSLHKIMYDHSSKENLAKFPQILTNLGCLHNCIACEMPQDSTERAKTLEEAEAYFEKALKINGPSHSLHFVYGNFLYSNKLSYSKAVSHFQAACEGRSDETEIFITVEIPDQEGVRSVTIDSATGSFYFLALCHHDMQDVYSQRKTLRIFAENAPTLPINKRSAALELCAFAHGIGGLSVKGDLLMEDAKKAEKAAKLLQKQQSVANMFKKAL